MQAEGRTHGAAVYPLVGYSVQELYETILSMEPESFRFLLEDARRNQEAVRRDLEDPELPLGRLLKQRISRWQFLPRRRPTPPPPGRPG